MANPIDTDFAIAQNYLQAYNEYNTIVNGGAALFSPEARQAWRKLMVARQKYMERNRQNANRRRAPITKSTAYPR